MADFLDSNVVLYAMNDEGVNYANSRRLLASAGH